MLIQMLVAQIVKHLHSINLGANYKVQHCSVVSFMSDSFKQTSHWVNKLNRVTSNDLFSSQYS